MWDVYNGKGRKEENHKSICAMNGAVGPVSVMATILCNEVNSTYLHSAIFRKKVRERKTSWKKLGKQARKNLEDGWEKARKTARKIWVIDG